MLTDLLLAHGPFVRLAAFFLTFVAIVLWEVLAPRRALTAPKARRWANNLALLLIDSVIVRLMFPAAAVGFAALAEANQMGLLRILEVPAAAAVVASVVLLDLAICFQHLMFLAVPLLWRLHRVHHADLDLDVTTGTRFHPIEILLSVRLLGCLPPDLLGLRLHEARMISTTLTQAS